ncbi:MAG TPA: MBG domain-containing protein [Candidatus Paceibacterota bacterium]|nr:MBG domain-containing protein [Candidatus Paceibacterota bacterium]
MTTPGSVGVHTFTSATQFGSSGVANVPTSPTITLTDTTPPTITLNGAANVEVLFNDTYIDAGATASDAVDGDLTSQILTTGLPVDTSVLGEHTVTYSVSDTAGNEAEETRTVTVVALEGEISLSDLTHTYDGTPKSATVTSELEYTVTYDGSETAPTNAGEYDVLATITEVGYTGSAAGTLTISPVAITVQADNAVKVFGEEDPALTYSITSGSLVGEDAFTGDVARQPGESVGTYAIGQGSLGLSDNYVLTFVDGTFTISIDPNNQSPVANNQALSVNEDSANNEVTLTADDAESAELTWTIVAGPTHGDLGGSGANRTYTPHADFYGSDSFTFMVNDGNSDSNVATVSIVVNLLAVCPDGFTQEGENCEPDVESVSACADGYSYDAGSDLCLPDPVPPSCPGDGSTLNTGTGMCDYPNQVPTCPTEPVFMVYNPTTGLCTDVPPSGAEATPTCDTANGYSLNTALGQCVKPSIDACPDGYVYNGEECESDGSNGEAPACPDGTNGTVEGGDCVLESASLICPVDGYHVEGLICVADVLFTISATAGANGSISPSGDTEVAEGGSLTFTITAASGFHVSDVVVDGASVGAVGTYTFEDVAANHTISASFAANSSGSSSSSSSSSGGGGGGGGGGSPAPRTTPTPSAQAEPQGEVLGATTSCYQFTRRLARGMSGDDVMELQKILIAKGYMKVAANGHFGPATEAAVKAYQKANGLEQVGSVGPLTRALLNKCDAPAGGMTEAQKQELIKKLQAQLEALLKQIAEIIAKQNQS